MSGARASSPIVALLPWGDTIEDFLDPIAVSFEAFRDEMTGGWLFGYVEALARAGVGTVLVCVSARVAEAERHVHRPTGAPLWVLPAPAAFRLARRWRPRSSPGAASYLATPPRALARVLRRENCSAVLCQEYEYPRFDACVVVGRMLGLPVFATFQGGSEQTTRLERPLRPWALRASAGLIVASRVEEARLRKRYRLGSARIARVFNPLDVSRWRALDRVSARAELGIPAAARVVAWHGRIDLQRKGLDLLVEAWAQVCRERPRADLRLRLLGTGPDTQALRTCIAAAPDARGIEWRDAYVVDIDKIRRHLAAADVYVLPSRHEGFAVAPVEAMACGLPLVAADAPGVVDLLEGGEEDGGLVVPRGDAGALAQALGALLDDPPRAAALGRRARLRVERCCSLEAVGRELRAVLAPAHREPGGGGASQRRCERRLGHFG